MHDKLCPYPQRPCRQLQKPQRVHSPPLQLLSLIHILYATFLETRSLHATAAELNKNYTTKNGARFTVLAVKDILKNPIYCTADALSYQYFLDSGANIFGGIEKFDANHGLAVYNKTDQMKVEDYESTFFNPKYVKATEAKPIEVWVVSVDVYKRQVQRFL